MRRARLPFALVLPLALAAEQVPVQPAGPVLLLVENLNPEASSLGYTLASKTP